MVTIISCSASPPLSVCGSLSLSSSELLPTRSTQLSWVSSFPPVNISIADPPTPTLSRNSVVRAAWTRRSRGEAAKKPNRKSWKQKTDMYMRPFLLNVFFSKKFIHAKVMHRGTSKVISVATTNAKDLRSNLPSLTDHNACRVIGRLIAERSKEADVYALSYEARKGERIEVVGSNELKKINGPNKGVRRSLSDGDRVPAVFSLRNGMTSSRKLCIRSVSSLQWPASNSASRCNMSYYESRNLACMDQLQDVVIQVSDGTNEWEFAKYILKHAQK